METLRAFQTKTVLILQMIKIEHTLFALPFALISALLAARSGSSGLAGWLLFWILMAMVGGRSTAMAFNRIIDIDIDRRNPRTANRHLPVGSIRKSQVWLFLIISLALFELAAWKLNRLCFLLSPFALFFLLGYSYTKRFTSLCHFALGFAIGLAPVGAWISVTGRIALVPILIGLAVMLWIGGFDIIYALQDYDFDVGTNVFSLPKRLGKARALLASRAMHAAALVLLIMVGFLSGLHFIYFFGVCVVAALIFYEQKLVRPDDLSHIDLAFFTLNGWVSVSFFLFVLLDQWLFH